MSAEDLIGDVDPGSARCRVAVKKWRFIFHIGGRAIKPSGGLGVYLRRVNAQESNVRGELLIVVLVGARDWFL
jgi:hypothetical protein